MRWGLGHLLFTSSLLQNSSPTPPPLKTPTDTSTLSTPNPPPPDLPLLADILPQEHIMVIRQHVCIGINQQTSPSQELWHNQVCLQLLINDRMSVVCLDGWRRWTTCRTTGISEGGTDALIASVQLVKTLKRLGLTHFLYTVHQPAQRWWMSRLMRLISITATLAVPLSLLPFLPSLRLPDL